MLLVKNVIDRDHILIHTANNASEELQGCIAPVICLTGEGRGISSKKAFMQMMSIANLSLMKKGTLFLTIKNTTS